MDFAIKIKDQGDTCEVTCSGSMNETSTAKLASITTQKTKVIFNLKDIVNVSSNGVRSWIQFLSAFQKGKEVILDECSPGIVTQTIMIPSFKGSAKIRSVYTLYQCFDCDQTNMHLLKPPLPSVEDISQKSCPNCGKLAQLEEDATALLGLFSSP